jgi:hypothetical protein
MFASLILLSLRINHFVKMNKRGSQVGFDWKNGVVLEMRSSLGWMYPRDNLRCAACIHQKWRLLIPRSQELGVSISDVIEKWSRIIFQSLQSMKLFD